MKYLLIAPPSSTEQQLSFEIPDLPATITPVITGTTPIQPTEPNEPPTVSAGASQTITLPINSATLDGSANDSDGTIVKWLWEKLSGSGTIVSPTTENTQVTGLTEGISTFRLTVTDDDGASTFATTTIIVKAAVVTPPPSTDYKLIYSNGFDTLAQLDEFSHEQLGKGSLSTAIKKEGTGSLKAYVPAGASSLSSGFRSEFQGEDEHAPDNNPLIYEYDVMYESLPNVTGLSFQVHGHQSNTSGQMSMWIESGRFKVQRNVNGVANYQSGTLMAVPLNKWLHFKWEILFTPQNTGYIRCYIDGQIYFRVENVKTSDGGGQYPKCGWNLFASPSKAAVAYWDNFKVYVKV